MGWSDLCKSAKSQKIVSFHSAMKKKSRFCINSGNHWNIDSIEDFCIHTNNIIQHRGHDVEMTNRIDYGAVNIFFEYFTEDTSTWLLNHRLNGAKYIIVATEFISNGTFNFHLREEKGRIQYGNVDYWSDRFKNFLEVAQFSEEVWVASSYQLDQYRAVLPDIPVKALPWGFDPFLLPTLERTPQACDIDVLFTGSLTKYRVDWLYDLSKALHLHIPPKGFASTRERIELLARSKINIHLGLIDGAMYTSPMRHHFALMNGVSVVSERSKLPGELDDCVLVAETGELIEKIEELLATGAWADYGLAMRERYRTEHSLDQPLNRLLEQWD